MPDDPHGLLAALIDDPDDDVRRLVYADWLEESGDLARAEFVRVQVEYDQLFAEGGDAACLDSLWWRKDKLWTAHQGEWLAPIARVRKALSGISFRRGFVSYMAFAGPEANDDLLPLLTAFPLLEALNLGSASVTPAGLVHLASLPCLRRVKLGPGIGVAEIGPLSGVPRLVRVEGTGWGEFYPQEVETFKAARNARFASLPPEARRREATGAVRYLARRNTFHPDGKLLVFLAAAHEISDADLVYLDAFPELESVEIGTNAAITSAGLAHLRGLQNLTALSIGGTRVADLAPLADLVALESLCLTSLYELDVSSLRHLARLPNLRRLQLDRNALTEDALPHLLALRGLEELDIGETSFRPISLARLRRLPRMRNFQGSGIM